MKRIISVIMAVLLMFSFAGCNKASSYKSGDEVSRRGPSVSAAEETVSEIESKAESEAVSEASSSEETVSVSSKVSSSEAVSSAAASSKSSSDNLAEEFDDSLIPLSVQDPSSVTLSDKLDDCTIELEGKAYKFPMTVHDFMADGWEIDYQNNNALSDPIDANSYYNGFNETFIKNGKSVQTDIKNFAKRKLNPIYCYITYFYYYYSEYQKDELASVKLPKGIEPMKSTVDDVKNAYGEPASFQTDSSETTMKYEKEDSNGYGYSYTFYFDEDSKLYCIVMNVNVQSPANFKEPAVVTDVPGYVTDYKAPAELGSDVVSGNVQLDKVVYNLPCPIKVFVDNGWSINFGGQTEEQTKSVASENYISLHLIKDSYDIEVDAYNRTGYEIPVENTIVEVMKLNRSSLKELDCKLPDGLDLSTTLSDIKNRSDFSKYTQAYFSIYNDTLYSCSKESERQAAENKNSYFSKSYDREILYCFVEDTNTVRYVKLTFKYWAD